MGIPNTGNKRGIQPSFDVMDFSRIIPDRYVLKTPIVCTQTVKISRREYQDMNLTILYSFLQHSEPQLERYLP